MANYIVNLVYTTLFGYLVLKITSYFVSLYQSRRFGASSPLPFVTIYSQTGSWLFWTLSPYLAPFIERLPFGLGHWCLYVKKDFAWHTKGELHRQELDSDVFWIVGPGGPNLWVADADVITQVTQRWKDFRKPVETYQVLDIYGPSVLSTEGATWQRHRRITGPPFHERNSRFVVLEIWQNIWYYLTDKLPLSLVFQESIAQGKGILASFIHDGTDSGSTPGQEPIVEDIGHWLMLVALNVISGAGFNLHIPWNTQSVELESISHQVNPNVVKKKGPTIELSKTERIQQSVSLVSSRFPLLILFPSWLLRISPNRSMRDVQTASEDFLAYMRKMIADYQSIPDTKGDEMAAPTSGRGDLLGSMVRAGKADKSMALTEKEIIGNLFVFVIAGHETTAITLQTGLLLLAINPSFQEEVQHEIDGMWATKSADDDFTYDDYPKMRVIMALMVRLSIYASLELGLTHFVVRNASTISSSRFAAQRNTNFPDNHLP